MSIDGYSLRVSVLENCQLRCNYCLPSGFKINRRQKNLLSIDAYKKIASAMSNLPIKKIRFTGGEPLIRKDLDEIIKVFRLYLQQSHFALTTNGLLYDSKSQQLKSAGLDSVTFHIDSLKRERYSQLMGGGTPEKVLSAIACAKKLGHAVKINCVVQQGKNDDELIDFLKLSKEISVTVRFIELMNTGSAQNYVAQTFISGRDILEKIAVHTPVESLPREEKSSPAERFYARDWNVEFGLIASDTRPFCNNCNRIRLSATGQLRTCLYEPLGVSLIDEADINWCEQQIIERIEKKIALKKSHHPALKQERHLFSMSQIGG